MPQSLSAVWEEGYSKPVIDLTWFSPVDCGTEACNSLRYRIERQTDWGPWVTAAEVFGSQGANHRFTSLNYGFTYNFRVTAVSGAGTSPFSNTASANPVLITKPNAPDWVSGCRMGERGLEYRITWGTSSGQPIYDGGSPITGFRLSWIQDNAVRNGEAVVSSSPTLISIAMQYPGTGPSDVFVWTRTAFGESSTFARKFVSGSSVCPGTESDSPSAPTGLTATLGETTGSYSYPKREVQFTWQPPLSDGGLNVTRYRLATSTNGGSSWTNNYTQWDGHWVTGTPPATSTTLTYYLSNAPFDLLVRVSAENLVGWGSVSETISVTVAEEPEPISEPLNLSSGDWPGVGVCWTCTPNQPGIIWSASENDGGSPILHYVVDVSTDGGYNWTRDPRTFNTTQAVPGVGSRYVATFDALPAGTTRAYRVAAVTSQETSPWSTTLTASTPEPQVTGLTLSPSVAAPGETVTATWQITDSGGISNINNVCSGGGYPMTLTVGQSPTRIETGYNTATGTCAGVTRVAGDAYSGTYQTQFIVPSDWIPWSNVAGYPVELEYRNQTSTVFTFTPLGPWHVSAPLPSLPAPGVTGVSQTSALITLPAEPDWSPGWANYLGSLFGYGVFTSPETPTLWCDGCVKSNSWNYQGGTPWTTQTQITDLSEATQYYVRWYLKGASGQVVWSPATSFTTTTSPGVPTSLQVSQIARSQGYATWNPPDFDGGCSTLAYELHISVNGSAWTKKLETTQNELEFWVAGEMMPIRYRVAAICAGNRGEFSNIDSVTYGSVPGLISSLSCLKSDGTRECSWNAPSSGGSPITHYELRYSYIVSSGSLEWTYIPEQITGTSYTITGLTFGNYSDRYFIHVLAFNEWGVSITGRDPSHRTGTWRNERAAHATEYSDS